MVLISEQRLVIYTDGGARGNPGPAAIGFLILSEEGKVLDRKGEYIGEATNNVAEYTAIIRALESASKFSSGDVFIYSDSQLVVNQLKGVYKVKKPHLMELLLKAKQKEKAFRKVEYMNIRRDDHYIPVVDGLVNQALDSAGSSRF